VARHETSSLRAALESFGRRAKRLSAARLEHHPEVLIELFGKDLVASVEDRRDAAQMTEHALRAIITSIPNPTDRRIADAIFAMSPEFWDMNITERQEYVDNEERPLFTRELYKTQRARILSDIASALPDAVGLSAGTPAGVVLSIEARHAADQLYRYLQYSVLSMDAYDFCANAIQEVEAVNKYSGKARFVATRRDPIFDEALWLYAYSHHYFNECLRQPTSRSFLRERLPYDWWRGTRFNVPFTLDDRELLLDALVAAPLDDPRSFGDELSKTEGGRILYSRWMCILGTTEPNDWTNLISKFIAPTSLERHLLIEAMKLLCAVLQPEFPAKTLSRARVEEGFCELVDVISQRALQQVRVYEFNKDGMAIHSHAYGLVREHPYPYVDNGGVADDGHIDWRRASPWWR